jgi:hypothetical protein
MERKVDRRKFLKATSAATTGLALTSVASASDGPVVKRLKGSYNQPISLSELRRTRKRAVDEHVKQGGTAPTWYAEADPVYPDEGSIVDYVVTVQPNGQPKQHVETVGDTASEAAAHAAADEAAQAFRAGEAGSASADSSGSDLSTQQSVDGDWNRITDDQGSYRSCPYGEVKHNFEWWKLDESVDDYGEDAHAVKQIASMTPGDDDDADTSPCDSDAWHNEWMMVKNDWDQAEVPNPALHEWDPYSTDANTVDVALSTSMTDAGLSWSFDNDGSIEYYVNGNEVQWELHGLYGTERNITQTMKPGTVCHFDEPSCDVKNQLTFLRMEGHFEDSRTNKYYLYYNWDLYYTRYC